MDTWMCERCGKACERPRVRGQRPKWCSTACMWSAKRDRLSAITHICEHCEATYHPRDRRQRYCSQACGHMAQAKPQPIKVVVLDQRSDLRRAIESRDLLSMRSALAARSVVVGECWEWLGRYDRSGYPVMSFGQRRGKLGVHRLVIEAVEGAPLGAQAAHHRCGSSRCVRPEHLQPVTQRENSAEMLARHSYVDRIAELEQALANLAPCHPLLDRIPLAG